MLILTAWLHNELAGIQCVYPQKCCHKQPNDQKDSQRLIVFTHKNAVTNSNFPQKVLADSIVFIHKNAVTNSKDIIESQALRIVFIHKNAVTNSL